MQQTYSLQKACRILDITPRTLRGMVHKGEIPAYRVGKRLLRFKAGDIENVMVKVNPKNSTDNNGQSN